jgi:hypothetical protein
VAKGGAEPVGITVQILDGDPRNAATARGEGPIGFSLDASLMTRFSLYNRFTFSMSRPGT